MQTIYAKEWLEIDFSSFSIMDQKNIADQEFYDKFYTKFYDKYSSYNELPLNYVNSKTEIVNKLVPIVKNKKTILSIGCGNGLIEHLLINKLKNINLIAMEPSSINSKWIQNNKNINFIGDYFPRGLKKLNKIDIAYANTIDYIFNDEEYLNFLKSLIDFGINDFILSELIEPTRNDLIPTVKQKIYKFLYKIKFLKPLQLWGYLRTIDEHIKIIKKAGFSTITYQEITPNSRKYLLHIKV